MKRLLAAMLLLGGVGGGVHAQTSPGTLSTVRVFTEPAGAKFVVDGTVYDRTAVFTWPSGSTHTLSVQLPGVYPNPLVPTPSSAESRADCPEKFTLTPGSQLSDACDTRWDFGGWTDGAGKLQAGSSPTITVTADPSITAYKATFAVQYKLRLEFYGSPNTPPAGPASCLGTPLPDPPERSQPGVVSVAGQCYWRSWDIWAGAGTVLPLIAIPYDGFAFLGFSVSGGPAEPYLSSIVMDGPKAVVARFAPGKSVKFQTEPQGFRLLIDRTEIPTVATWDGGGHEKVAQFWWAAGTQHVLAAPSPQTDSAGDPWFLDSFSIGGGQNTVYTVTDVNVPIVITAKFVRGAFANIFTNPAGLKLKIDGRDNWMGNTFTWPVGSKHTIEAPAEQVDSGGRRYRFTGWSNNGPARQEITVSDSAVEGGLRLVAYYERLAQLTVRSSIPGVPITVDGTECRTPCTLDRQEGAEVRLAAASIPLSSVERLEFISWSDGGSAAERTVKLQGGDPVVLTVNFQKAYLFQAAVEPSGGAIIRCEPASADQFYREGVEVSVTAQVKPGYRFRRWEGDLTGTYKTGAFRMDGPKTVRALLDIVPYVAPGGVKNAAGETPDPVVAPGSLISIFGASLAQDYVVGPVNPLAQTLAGVTVQVAGRLLPLLFVSPTQINAQLPSDLEEGSYTLKVQRAGYEDVTVRFEVARNAPGLFTVASESGPYALGLHEDGKLISPVSPARAGELVTLYGTGFGPYTQRPPDGFNVPMQPAYPLEDLLEVYAGEKKLELQWAGAAPGYVGMCWVRFKLPDELEPGKPLGIRVRVNGRESNTAPVPIDK